MSISTIHTTQHNILLNEDPPWAELRTGTDSPIRALAFTPDEEYVVGGDKEKIRVWRLSGNQAGEIAAMEMKDVRCIAVSKDSRWIAAATSWGEMRVWDAKTFKEFFCQDVKDSDGHTITSLDFSPDAPTRLLTGSGNRKSCIWEVEARRKVVKDGEHPNWVIAARFSPRGDRYATATFRDHIRVYDSRSGNLMVTIDSDLAKVVPYYNTGLLWSGDASILVLSKQSINRITVSTKSVTPEWSVDDGNYPCIVSPESGQFVLYSTGYDISLFNASLGPRDRGPNQLAEDAQSIALSPDGQFLAIGGWEGTVIVKGSNNRKRNQLGGVPTGRKSSRHN